MSRVKHITSAPCNRYVLGWQKKRKENIKVVMNTKPNTNHAAIATQIQRHVEKKVYTHHIDS